MLKHSLIILLICAVYSFGCNEPSNTRISIENKSIDTVLKIIPKRLSGQMLYQKKLQLEKILLLDHLENGFDSLQFRFWYGHARSDTIRLIIIKSIKKIWTSEINILKIHSNGGSTRLIWKDRRIVEPNSGWSNFRKNVLTDDIVNLRDAEEIPEYEICSDGDGITIEIGTEKLYKIVNYPCFSGQRNFQAGNQINRIFELLKQEFRF